MAAPEMGLFGAIGVAGTGLAVQRKWLDAVADNLANVNDAARTSGPAFQARYVVARPVAPGAGGGVEVGGIVLGDPVGRLVQEPANPLADKDGMVRYPDIDLASQMAQMIMAQRAYQANLAVVDRAHDAYSAALELGRSA